MSSTVIFLNVLIDFQESLNLGCLPWFSHAANIRTPGFSTVGRCVFLLDDQREKYCLTFHQFKCVISKQYNLGITSSLNC